MTSYSYTLLNKFARKTRLLTLLPGNIGEDIHVQLRIRTLTSTFTPSYDALSYAWGTTDDPTNIYVGTSKDYLLSVTRNLACALIHLRLKDKSRTLWIDAICVDQHNDEERSQQVGMMADIYRLAKRVVVWVGPEADESSLAMGILRTLGTKVNVDWLMSLMIPSREAKREGETHWADASVSLPFKSEEGIPIRHFLSRSWFERLWTRQEICLANPDAIIMCGFDTISWPTFRKAVFCLETKRGPHGYYGPNKTEFKARLKMIHQLSNKGRSSFGQLLHDTSNCKCSDPRDRIYALLSIYTRDLHIVPDYSLSKAEVYQDFCLRHIDSVKYRNLNILTWCDMPISASDLPTWVPDWCIRHVAKPIQTSFATGKSTADAHYLGGGVLRTSGVKVANIIRADEISITEMSTTETVALIRQLAPSNLDIDGGVVFDTYCRTLCCNQFCDSLDPPAPKFPSLDKSKEALRLFLGLEGNAVPEEPFEHEIERYANWARYFMRGRSFFSTDKGHIGLGPRASKPGDIVVIFPGCDSPMSLRSTKNGQYEVVGECFILNLSHCETLLGPLPKEYQQIFRQDLKSNQTGVVYYNRNTGRTQTVDPRFTLFRSELQKDGVRKIYVREPGIDADNRNDGGEIRILTSDFKSDSKICRLVGVKIEPFELV